MQKTTAAYFTKQLLQWHFSSNNRQYPWKSEQDAYKIWLSEIILQQTRSEQGLPYYLRFVEAYPTVSSLAAAQETEVFRLWQGLGYYARCKNMLKTAKQIHTVYQGQFPKTYAEIIALPGIGPYTAAAIASFAFGLPYPVIDGNVYRVLARFFAIDLPIDTKEGQLYFQEKIKAVFDPKQPAAFNQAIMDFGATICKPKNPLCDDCPLVSKCEAYKLDLINTFPVKSKKLQIKQRHFYYWAFVHENKLYLRERVQKDIWQHLYELFLVEDNDETPKFLNQKNILQHFSKVYQYKQKLTHQVVNSSFEIVVLKNIPHELATSGIWISKENIKNYAFPKTIVSFLNENPYF